MDNLMEKGKRVRKAVVTFASLMNCKSAVTEDDGGTRDGYQRKSYRERSEGTMSNIRTGRMSCLYVTSKLQRLRPKPGSLVEANIVSPMVYKKKKNRKRSGINLGQIFQQPSALNFLGFIGMCHNLFVFTI